MARVTSKDVARQAGVSIATVSHVINQTRHVSEETRQKVLDTIEALKYSPNAVARSLVTNLTHTIGLVVSDITNPFFPAVIRGIESEILGHRYNLILCNTDEDAQREEDALRLLATQQIDGLIVAPTGVRCAPLLALAESGVPIIQLDRISPNLDAPVVAVNNEDGAYQAIRYLIGLGHRRIAYLMGLDTISTQTERLQGWKRALTEAGLPIDDRLIVRADPRFYGVQAGAMAPVSFGEPTTPRGHMPGAYDVLQDLFRLPEHPSAIFVASNQLTLGTLYALRACELQCPEQVSLISFDDHDWAPLFSPPLTVVRQPTYELGQTAAHLLMQMIRDEPIDDPVPLRVELVARASCAPPPAEDGPSVEQRVADRTVVSAKRPVTGNRSD
jgi:LacI family transcriptional regulator